MCNTPQDRLLQVYDPSMEKTTDYQVGSLLACIFITWKLQWRIQELKNVMLCQCVTTKIIQSFEMLRTTHPVTQHHIQEKFSLQV